MTQKEFERRSCAITLSDMEIFVFPELMYSLVLANIMSPIIWRWREEKSFQKLQDKNSYRKLLRLRQFIMDEYEFNLDLETWGLTSKAREQGRFENYISSEDIAGSNALFGYHGDSYYFDVDIRRHFGLDQYDEDVIPYWKTETIEAMDAFRYRKGYTKKAGECVSLSALYAAAAFVVCQVPLEDIFMILTPLHSQNFIDVNDGLITNNRRLVTKGMWFNGTAISMKSQRALKNEQVTIVTHSSGWAHCVYDQATIDPQAYEGFNQKLSEYLSVRLDGLIFSNFLRAHSEYRKYFQYCRQHRGEKKFVKAEILFHYEHGSRFRVAEETFDKLLEEVSDEDYSPYDLSERLCYEKLDDFLSMAQPDVRTEAGRKILKEFLDPHLPVAEKLVELLAEFVHAEAKLPRPTKGYVADEPIRLSIDQSREEIIDYLQNLRDRSTTADLAFYAYRDVANSDWQPLVKAALERNPVSLVMANKKTNEQVFNLLNEMDNESIYEGKRLAQPDEVTNYGRGDGIEKALVLANVINHRQKGEEIKILIDDKDVVLKADQEYRFESTKGITKEIVTDLIDTL